MRSKPRGNLLFKNMYEIALKTQGFPRIYVNSISMGIRDVEGVNRPSKEASNSARKPQTKINFLLIYFWFRDFQILSRGISLLENAYEIPNETKGFLQDPMKPREMQAEGV